MKADYIWLRRELTAEQVMPGMMFNIDGQGFMNTFVLCVFSCPRAQGNRRWLTLGALTDKRRLAIFDCCSWSRVHVPWR